MRLEEECVGVGVDGGEEAGEEGAGVVAVEEEERGASIGVGEDFEDGGPEEARESSWGMARTATREKKPGSAATRLPSSGFWCAQRPWSGDTEWRKRHTVREEPPAAARQARRLDREEGRRRRHWASHDLSEADRAA